MSSRFGWGAAGLVLGSALMLSLPSFGGSSTVPPSPAPGTSLTATRTVTVAGTAVIRSQPDEAVVSLGVQAQATTAGQALQDDSGRMAKVIQALLAAGVDRTDIGTTSVNLSPQYNSRGDSIEGYVAQNQVDVTVRDLSKVGTVIDRSVAAGANLAGGVTFRLSDQNRGVTAALAEAVGNARAKAQALAAAGGATLGQVVRIDETSAGSPPYPYAEKAADASGGTPIMPGTIETQVTVTVVWALA
jgi:uncharacterized protein